MLLLQTLRSDSRVRREQATRRRRPGRLHRPVFVLGAPRSGTTFLGSALGAMPEFSYHFEPMLTKALVAAVAEGKWRPRAAGAVFRLTYSALLWNDGGGDRRFTEKTPQNCFIVQFLGSQFPDAQFVAIVRDGRDAALSYAEKPWLAERSRDSGRREPGGYSYGPYPRFWVEPDRRQEFATTSDLHRCVWAWRRHTEAMLADGRRLPADRYLELRYEDLVASPQEHGGRIADFLSVAPDGRAALLEALAAGRTQSVGRWRSELSDADLTVMMNEAGPLLMRLGYG
jgi:Sulfotransferase family